MIQGVLISLGIKKQLEYLLSNLLINDKDESKFRLNVSWAFINKVRCAAPSFCVFKIDKDNRQISFNISVNFILVNHIMEVPSLLGHPVYSHVYWGILYIPMFIGAPCIFPCLLGHPVYSHVYLDTLYIPMFIGTPCIFPCLLRHPVYFRSSRV